MNQRRLEDFYQSINEGTPDHFIKGSEVLLKDKDGNFYTAQVLSHEDDKYNLKCLSTLNEFEAKRGDIISYATSPRIQDSFQLKKAIWGNENDVVNKIVALGQNKYDEEVYMLVMNELTDLENEGKIQNGDEVWIYTTTKEDEQVQLPGTVKAEIKPVEGDNEWFKAVVLENN